MKTSQRKAFPFRWVPSTSGQVPENDSLLEGGIDLTMHSLHRTIKTNALRALRGNWGKAVASTLLLGSLCAFFFLLGQLFFHLFELSNIIDFLDIPKNMGQIENPFSVFLVFLIALLGVFAAFLVIVPLVMGLLRWYSHTVLDGSEEITAVFYYFSKLKLLLKSLLLAFNVLCRKVFWGIVCLFPGGLVAGISMYIVSLNPNSKHILFSKLCILLGFSLLVVGVLVYGLINIRYQLAAYLMIRDETLSVSRCIRQSSRYTLSHRGDLFVFVLSFLPLILLCVLFLPFLFVFPFFLTSCTIYAQYLIEQNERALSENEVDPPLPPFGEIEADNREIL